MLEPSSCVLGFRLLLIRRVSKQQSQMAKQQSQMARCALCNDQEKKREYQPRLAFNFTLEELLQSACDCNSCLVILEGLRQARSLDGCSLLQDVRSVYARCHNQRKDHRDSLSLEVYFFDERPRLELEFYSLQPQGTFTVAMRLVKTFTDTSISLESHTASTTYQWSPPFRTSLEMGTVTFGGL